MMIPVVALKISVAEELKLCVVSLFVSKFQGVQNV